MSTTYYAGKVEHKIILEWVSGNAEPTKNGELVLTGHSIFSVKTVETLYGADKFVLRSKGKGDIVFDRPQKAIGESRLYKYIDIVLPTLEMAHADTYKAPDGKIGNTIQFTRINGETSDWASWKKYLSDNEFTVVDEYGTELSPKVFESDVLRLCEV
ncbi:MAG: hypothetical protein LBN42_01815 [Oscillospiraceae bacterium]|jgi:hypothetical protein|nr:hypothetical protein [Oscillospiraceae bacterium]